MQKFCNRIIIALHLYNRQPKQFGIIHTPLMQAKKRISTLLKILVLSRLYRRFEDAMNRFNVETAIYRVFIIV
jgi:5-bromo-4-chloroindolyl phosphate hydrolysis protein